MHFQLPPYDVDKIITVINGCVLNVIFDMRKKSTSFGKIHVVKLGPNCTYRSLYIPKGCAHGFLSLMDNSFMFYQISYEFFLTHDSGFRYNSFGFDWPINTNDIIITDKDLALPEWNE